MLCAWKQLLAIVPQRLRKAVDELGRESMEELRLRINAPPEVNLGNQSVFLRETVTGEDLTFCVNAASRYSPWAAATMAKGYLTAPGGHRIGLCGSAVCREGMVTGIQTVLSLNIRVARDFPGAAEQAAEASGSVLILGAPGWGKTTLLRDLCRKISREACVAVVDERGELFPEGIQRGKRMDVLSGCPKVRGIDMLLRTMGPAYIAVDEITAREDCEALAEAANCGVKLLATAHGTCLQDYFDRPAYRQAQGLFQTVILLKQDKGYTLERICR